MLIAVANAKGGQGKSTWSGILASWLEAELLDADFEQGDSAAFAERAGLKARLVRPEQAKTVFTEARNSEPWAVVDCPPNEGAATLLALSLAHVAFVPIVPGGIQDASAWGRMKSLLSMAKEANPGMKIAVVLNNVRTNTGIASEFEEMLREFHQPSEGQAVLGILPQRVAYVEGYGTGKVRLDDPAIAQILRKLKAFAAK